MQCGPVDSTASLEANADGYLSLKRALRPCKMVLWDLTKLDVEGRECLIRGRRGRPDPGSMTTGGKIVAWTVFMIAWPVVVPWITTELLVRKVIKGEW